MAARQRRYSKEDRVNEGKYSITTAFGSNVIAGNKGKIVAIDIKTGAFEVDNNVLPATIVKQPFLASRLFERNPDAQPWVIRIAHRAVYHFGALMFSEKVMIQGVERW